MKVLAAMLPNVAFDELWNRYERDKAEEQRKERERRDGLLRMQSRLVAKEAISILDKHSSLAQLLSLEILPHDLGNPDRPYTTEGEHALRATASLVNTELFRGHTSAVSAISYSPDGKLIASISSDFTIKLWDVGTGRIEKTLNSKHPFGSCVAFYPDGERIIAGYGDGVLETWNIVTGEVEDVKTPTGKRETIYSVAVSCDGKLVAFSTDEELYIINSENESRLQCHIELVRYVAFSPDGHRIVSVSHEGKVMVLDLVEEVYKEIKSPECEGDELSFVYAAFSSDGNRIAVVLTQLFESSVGVYDFVKEQWIKVLADETIGPYVAAAFGENSDTVYLVNKDGGIVLCDIETGTYLLSFKDCHGEIDQSVIDFSGKRIGLVVDEDIVVVEDVLPQCVKKVLFGGDERIKSLAFTSDGAKVVSESYEEIKLWDVNTGSFLYKLTLDEKFTLIQNSSDHSISADGLYRIAVRDKSVEVISARSGKKEQSWGLESNPTFFTSAISPNGKLIAFSDYTDLSICDVKTGKVRVLKGQSYRVNSIVFSSDGKRIVSGDNKNIKCWDVETGEEIWTVGGFEGKVCSLAFSPDGKYIAAAFSDAVVGIIDSGTASTILVFQYHCQSVDAVVFSPDGRRIASASKNGVIIIWDFPPLQELIDQTRERFKDRPLTPEERRQYYLE